MVLNIDSFIQMKNLQSICFISLDVHVFMYLANSIEHLIYIRHHQKRFWMDEGL